MEEKSLEFLKKLINTPSPSGFESAASEVWQDYLRIDYLPWKDAYGNTYARLMGNWQGPTVMLSGHIDEVGFMVNYINSNGYVYVSAIGGVDQSIAVAQRVMIHNKNGPIRGVFGKTAIHLLDSEDSKTPKLHQMFVDIGAKDKEDAMKMISVGDPITFEAGFEMFPNNRIIGRGLDDRMGAWCVAETLKRLKNKKIMAKDIYGVATIQEENGIYGATMAVETVKPHIAIAIDVTHATDSPGISNERCGDIELGEGPTINIGSTSHPKVNEKLISIAEKNRIPLQTEASPRRSGTDADRIFLARGGIPTSTLSTPCRYMHTPVEMISLDDLENTVKLLVEFCIECDRGIV